jgi:aminoglycoside phosphotransferase (APT) family kinase protein
MMRLAREHLVPVPVVYEVREDALVMERIPGETLLARIGRRPWTLPAAAGVIADLHERLHAIPFEGGRLVHFDLHPDNVLIGPDGPVLIDWTNAHGGDPAGDVAMTWLILDTSAGLFGRWLAALFRGRVGAATIRRGLDGARAFRLADPNVTDAERALVRRAAP